MTNGRLQVYTHSSLAIWTLDPRPALNRWTHLVGPAKKLLAELIKEEQGRQREEAGKAASINDEGSQSDDDEDDEGPSAVGLGATRGGFDLLSEVIVLAGDHVDDIEVERELEDGLTRYDKLKFDFTYFRGEQREFDNFDVIA